jgi:hypothetical protein
LKKCSYCGRENDDTAPRCSECGTELESSNATDGDPHLHDSQLSLVIVGTYLTVVDAAVAKSRLEGAGIEACIPEEYTPQILWFAIPSPLERVTVRVAAKDYDLAKEVLSESGSAPLHSE